MLKYALLASAVLIASPAAAQHKSGHAAGATTTSTAPVTDTATVPSSASDPQAAAAPTDTASDPTAPAQTAATQPAAPAADAPAQGAGVAQVVEKEFPSYDKNGDGALDKTEFAAWMTALKSADGAKHDAAADAKWDDAAFAQADKDKSKSLSKTELTSFLGQGQKAS